MAATINLVAHTLMGAPPGGPARSSLLVEATYEIVVWTYVGQGVGLVHDVIDFSAAAGGGTGVTARVIVPATGNIPTKYLFRRVDHADPIILSTANDGNTANTAGLGYLVRTGATTFGLRAYGAGTGATGLTEFANATDFAAAPIFVTATPSRARFRIIGQPSIDPVDTPLAA